MAVRSGGRLSALLTTAMFQTISECHNLDWEVVFQGINVADSVSGAVGDITIKKHGAIVLGIEVTDRKIDRGRVTSTFESKIAPNGLEDYLFVTTVLPERGVYATLSNYTGVGHEMNFVQLQAWLVNNLATIGPRCPEPFFKHACSIFCSLKMQSLKVAWNAKDGCGNRDTIVY